MFKRSLRSKLRISVLLLHNRLTIRFLFLHFLIINRIVLAEFWTAFVFHRFIHHLFYFPIYHLHLLLLLLVLSEDFLLLHSIIVSLGLLRIILILFFVLIALHLHLLLILHLFLHGLLLHLQVIHILYIFSILHLCRRHGECFLIEESDYTLLAQHQLDHSFSFVLIKFILFVEGALSAGSSHTAINTSSLRWCHEIDADTETRLSRVHFHLGVSLVMFPF